jgi:hypothetical protein
LPEYLFHSLSARGARAAAESVWFETDECAIRHALAAYAYGCELWRDHRLLGRICGPAPTSRPELEAKAAA